MVLAWLKLLVFRLPNKAAV